MKTRNGFVSNSSSSSFIVGFKEIPKSVEELQKLLFGDSCCIAAYGDTVSAKHAAEFIFGDLQRQKPSSPEDVVKEVQGGYFPGYPNMNYGKDNDWDAFWQLCSEKGQEVAQKFLNENPDCTFFVFSYGDNGGNFEATLEHGNTFKNLPHLHISHH